MRPTTFFWASSSLFWCWLWTCMTARLFLVFTFSTLLLSATGLLWLLVSTRVITLRAPSTLCFGGAVITWCLGALFGPSQPALIFRVNWRRFAFPRFPGFLSMSPLPGFLHVTWTFMWPTVFNLTLPFDSSIFIFTLAMSTSGPFVFPGFFRTDVSLLLRPLTLTAGLLASWTDISRTLFTCSTWSLAFVPWFIPLRASFLSTRLISMAAWFSMRLTLTWAGVNAISSDYSSFILVLRFLPLLLIGAWDCHLHRSLITGDDTASLFTTALSFTFGLGRVLIRRGILILVHVDLTWSFRCRRGDGRGKNWSTLVAEGFLCALYHRPVRQEHWTWGNQYIYDLDSARLRAVSPLH